MSYNTKIISVASTLIALLFGASTVAEAKKEVAEAKAPGVRYVMCMDSVPGPGVGAEFDGCSAVNALGLTVDRVLGPTGGSTPINIGLGELGPIVIKKPTDAASVGLFTFAVNGNSVGNTALFAQEERKGWPGPLTTLEVKLERAFVKSMKLNKKSLTEKLELIFVKIQLTLFERDENGDVVGIQVSCWDTVNNIPSCSL